MLEPGISISHYRIISSLGAGGMGEVYKAHDLNLDRPVALKILPPELVRNDDRVRRFVQEAKSASSLNHPHIVTIHEIGHVDLPEPLHYIAMELIDGLTLGQKIHHEETDLKTLLVYLAQAAEGLAKAHAAGIIHRDLKPENIMITRDGYAKVLDFGLAKLSARKGADGGTDAPTQAREHTREGAVLGTVAYMSPEQVQGKVVDHRSDIFSFGCILYEAATRRRAFEADSDIDVMHKIVHDKPPAIDEINPNVPAELRRMIRRCLAKEPDKRYQSMKDLAIELGDVVEEFDELSASAASHTSASVSISSPPMVPTRRRTAWMFAAAAVVTAGVTFSIIQWKRASRSTPLQSMRLQRLTNDGNVTWASISPDGRYVAHTIRDENLAFTLVVRQVATGSNVKLVGPSPASITRPRFSPDGNYIYYGHYDRQGGGGVATLNQIAALGGAPKKVLNDIDTPLSFSPDGKRIAFGRGLLSKGVNDILVANSDGTGQRVIATHKRVSNINLNPIEAVWSADGKNMITANASTEGGPHDELVEIDLASGNKRVIGGRWFKIWGLARLPDGSGVVLSAVDAELGRAQLWLQPIPEGQPRRITNDLNSYYGVSLTSDGKTLATTQVSVRSRLFHAAPDDETGGRPLTAELPEQSLLLLSAAADGRIVYDLASGSTVDVWLLDPSGSAKQLTTDGISRFPSISFDGGTILFTSTRNGGVPHVWRMDSDGSNARQVTRGGGEDLLAASPDGKLMVLWDISSGVSRIEGSGGATRTVEAGLRPGWFGFSPDGKLVAYEYWKSADELQNHRLAVIPSSGGKPILDVEAGLSRDIDWTPSGDAVTYSQITGGARNIWKQPLDGSPAKQMTHFKGGMFESYAWLPDGTLVVSRENQTRDVVLISDFH